MSKNPKKIIIYTDTPLYGGAEHQMFLLCKYLNKKLFEPILVCRHSEVLLPWIEKFQKLGITTYLISSKSKHSPKNFIELEKIIKKEKPDLMHINAWNPMAGKFAIFAAKLKNLPIVITEHDPFHLNALKKIYKNWSLHRVQKIITVSLANQKLITEIYPLQEKKITTIYNGIERTTAISEQQKLIIRKNIFKTGPTNRIIFCAGTLHPRKGYKYLIAAFKKVNQKFPDSKLIIAGEGPQREFLEDLIKNLSLQKKVMLLGLRNDISDLMKASDLFILPSIKEAFGLVILEAIDSHLPIIASAVGGVPEIIDAQSGILIKPANKNELIKAINKLFNNPTFAKKLAQQALIKLKSFTAEKTALNTEKIYTELLQ